MSYSGVGATNLGGDSVWCTSVLAVQKKLAYLGFYAGPQDGKANNALMDASKAFAQHMGISLPYINKAFCQALDAAYTSKLEAGQGAAAAEPPAGGEIVTAPTSEEGAVASGACSGWWGCLSTGKKVALGLGGLAVVGLVGVYFFAPKSFFGGTAMTANRRRGHRKNGFGSPLYQVGDKVRVKRWGLVGVVRSEAYWYRSEYRYKVKTNYGPRAVWWNESSLELVGTGGPKVLVPSVGVSRENVHVGDRVWWIDRFGKSRSGRVYIKESGHVVVAQKGRSASPNSIPYDEIVQVRHGNWRTLP